MSDQPIKSSTDYHKPRFNGTFVALGRYVITFLCGALLSAFVFGGKSQQFTDLLVWKGETITQLKTLETKVANNEYEIKSEVKDATAYETRLKKAEEQTGKIDTMTFKIDNLITAVNELKARHP